MRRVWMYPTMNMFKMAVYMKAEFRVEDALRFAMAAWVKGAALFRRRRETRRAARRRRRDRWNSYVWHMLDVHRRWDTMVERMLRRHPSAGRDDAPFLWFQHAIWMYWFESAMRAHRLWHITTRTQSDRQVPVSQSGEGRGSD